MLTSSDGYVLQRELILNLQYNKMESDFALKYLYNFLLGGGFIFVFVCVCCLFFGGESTP